MPQAIRIESEPSQPSGIRFSRRRFLENLAMAGGGAVAFIALADEAIVSGDIALSVSWELPQIIPADDKSAFNERRKALNATRNRSPQQDDSLKMMDQVLQFDAIQEPRRKQRADGLKAESDNTVILGIATRADIKNFAFNKGLIVAGLGALGRTRLPDKAWRRIISFMKS